MGGKEGEWRTKGKVEKPEVLVSFDLGSFYYALCPLAGSVGNHHPTPARPAFSWQLKCTDSFM